MTLENNEWEKTIEKKFKEGVYALICSNCGGGGEFEPGVQCKKCEGTGLTNWNIDLLKQFISSLLAQTRQDTVREVIENIIKQKQAVTINYDGPLNEIIENAQKLVIINDVGLEIIEQYGMKEEYGVEDE